MLYLNSCNIDRTAKYFSNWRKWVFLIIIGSNGTLYEVSKYIPLKKKLINSDRIFLCYMSFILNTNVLCNIIFVIVFTQKRFFFQTFLLFNSCNLTHHYEPVYHFMSTAHWHFFRMCHSKTCPPKHNPTTNEDIMESLLEWWNICCTNVLARVLV